MPRLSRPLNKDEVAKLARQPGSHPVGASLFLLVRAPDKAYWVHRYHRPNKPTSSESFGPYPAVTLAQARKKREDANARRRNGGAEQPPNRAQEATGKTFAVAR